MWTTKTTALEKKFINSLLDLNRKTEKQKNWQKNWLKSNPSLHFWIVIVLIYLINCTLFIALTVDCSIMPKGTYMGYWAAPEGGSKTALRLMGMQKGCITPTLECYWTALPKVVWMISLPLGSFWLLWACVRPQSVSRMNVSHPFFAGQVCMRQGYRCTHVGSSQSIILNERGWLFSLLSDLSTD